MQAPSVIIYKPVIPKDSELVQILGEAAVEKLFSLLINNNIEVVLKSGCSKIILVNCENLLDDIFEDDESNSKIVHIPVEVQTDGIFNQIEKVVSVDEKLLFIKGNTIGLTDGYLLKISNQLELEEDVCVINYDDDDELCAYASVGVNSFMTEQIISGLKYSSIIKNDSLPDKFFIFQKEIHSINFISDFPKLYNYISIRENEHLCSKYFYDQFTEIFIEFRDLLK